MDAAHEIEDFEAQLVKNISRQRRTIPIMGDVMSWALNWCCGVMTQDAGHSLFTNQQQLQTALDSVKNAIYADFAYLSNVTLSIERLSEDYATRRNSLHSDKSQIGSCQPNDQPILHQSA